MSNDRTLYIFLHLVKTGGMTVWQMLEKALPGKAVRCDLSAIKNGAVKDSTRILAGHFQFGIHQHIDRPCRYFTILRHPVDRVISDYFYCLLHDRPRHHKAVSNSLYQWPQVVGPRYQTATLAGVQHNGDCAKLGLFARAWDNLSRWFDHVGTLEDWAETEEWLIDTFGCEPAKCYQNVNSQRPSVREEDRQAIGDQVEGDMAIWQIARGIDPIINSGLTG